MMEMIIVTIAIIVLPIALFFGIVGLAIFIWCWNRIGRYFINFGRWLGSWRNFIPLSILGVLSFILILVVLPIIGLSRTVLAVLLVLFLLATIVIFMFAIVAWIIRFCQWFWPPYRRLVWSAISSMWGSLPQRSGKSRRRAPKPSAGPPSSRQPITGTQKPSERSWLASFWALMLGKTPAPAKSGAATKPGTANIQPPPGEAAPTKRSWFGSFWALMMGKPQPTRRQARPTSVQTTEQTLGPSGTLATARGPESGAFAAPPTKKVKPSRHSWFGSFWALMLGSPSKSTKPKPRPAKTPTTDQTSVTPDNAAATANTGATTTVAETATGSESVKAEPAKQGTFGRIWTSVIRGVTVAAGLVILGVLWVGRKIGEGIEWIRIRLNLD